MNDFVIEWIDHLENIGSQSQCGFAKCWHIKNIFKVTVVNITINLIRKVEELESYQTYEYKFSKALILTGRLECYHQQ